MLSSSSFNEFYYLDKKHIVTWSLRLGVWDWKSSKCAVSVQCVTG